MALRRQNVIGGKRLECKKAKPKAIFGDYDGNEANLITKKVFVGGLAEGVTEDQVREAFSAFGNIVDSILLPDRQSDSGRCFAFVTFDSPFCVESIMENYYDVKVANKWVGIRLMQVECKRVVASSGGRDEKGHNSKRNGRDGGASNGVNVLPNYGSERVVSSDIV